MRIVGIFVAVGGAYLFSLAFPTASGGGAFALCAGALLFLAGGRAVVKGRF